MKCLWKAIYFQVLKQDLSGLPDSQSASFSGPVFHIGACDWTWNVLCDKQCIVWAMPLEPSTYIKNKMEELQVVGHDVYRFTHLPLEALLPSFAPQTLDGTRYPAVCSPHRINQSRECALLSLPWTLLSLPTTQVITVPLGWAALLSVNLRIYFHLFPLFSALVSFSSFTCKKICESSKLLHSGKKKSILIYVMKQSLSFTVYSFILLWWEPCYVSLAAPTPELKQFSSFSFTSSWN